MHMYTKFKLMIYLQKVGLHKRGKACLIIFSVPEVKILTSLSYYIASIWNCSVGKSNYHHQ